MASGPGNGLCPQEAGAAGRGAEHAGGQPSAGGEGTGGRAAGWTEEAVARSANGLQLAGFSDVEEGEKWSTTCKHNRLKFQCKSCASPQPGDGKCEPIMIDDDDDEDDGAAGEPARAGSAAAPGNGDGGGDTESEGEEECRNSPAEHGATGGVGGRMCDGPAGRGRRESSEEEGGGGKGLDISQAMAKGCDTQAARRRCTASNDAAPRKGRPRVHVEPEAIRALFFLPQPRAAVTLGISLTALKTLCRQNGIERWPYRRGVLVGDPVSTASGVGVDVCSDSDYEAHDAARACESPAFASEQDQECTAPGEADEGSDGAVSGRESTEARYSLFSAGAAPCSLCSAGAAPARSPARGSPVAGTDTLSSQRAAAVPAAEAAAESVSQQSYLDKQNASTSSTEKVLVAEKPLCPAGRKCCPGEAGRDQSCSSCNRSAMTLKQPRLFEREPPRAIVTTAEGGCNPQSTRSMSEMERIKEEPVAEYDGSYECLICSESVRGTAALKCTQCQSNPFHRACVGGSQFAQSCPSCQGQTVAEWDGKSTAPAAAGAKTSVVDLTIERPAASAHGGAKDKELQEGGGSASEDACTSVEEEQEPSDARKSAPKKSTSTNSVADAASVESFSESLPVNEEAFIVQDSPLLAAGADMIDPGALMDETERKHYEKLMALMTPEARAEAKANGVYYSCKDPKRPNLMCQCGKVAHYGPHSEEPLRRSDCMGPISKKENAKAYANRVALAGIQRLKAKEGKAQAGGRELLLSAHAPNFQSGDDVSAGPPPTAATPQGGLAVGRSRSSGNGIPAFTPAVFHAQLLPGVAATASMMSAPVLNEPAGSMAVHVVQQQGPIAHLGPGGAHFPLDASAELCSSGSRAPLNPLSVAAPMTAQIVAAATPRPAAAASPMALPHGAPPRTSSSGGYAAVLSGEAHMPGMPMGPSIPGLAIPSAKNTPPLGRTASGGFARAASGEFSRVSSAVANGKGGELMAFLIEAQIPTDKWPSLLGCSSLCSAVANGKGGELLEFLIESRIARDKWPSLLGRNSLCSAVANGKGGELLAFLIEAQIPREKWPSLLGCNSLCSAVANGKGGELMKFLDEAQIPRDKWPSLLGSGGLCSAVVDGKGGEPSGTYIYNHTVSKTQWRNERRKQGRRNVNSMLAQLDEILPKPFQSSPSPNCAGGRAVGAQGRSLHDVLNDTVRYISNLKQDSLHQAHGVDKAEAVKQSMQSAKSMLCVEVEGGKGDSCTITGMGEGAKSFFKNSPWGDAHGHSLAHFIRCEDLPAFHRLVDASRQSKIDKNNPEGALGAGVPLSMMHFSRMAAVQGQGDGDWPGKARPSQASFMRLPSAFTYDPLLDPCPPEDLGDAPPTPLAPDGKPPRTCGWDASESNADAAVTCSYVPMSMQLHVVPSSEAETEAGTPIEGPLSVGGEEDAAWKAVVLSPLDVGMGVTTIHCPCCGGGGGTLGGCRRSALMSLSPPMPPMSLSPAMAVAVPVVEPSPACMMPGQPASVASVAPAWPFFAGHGRTAMPFHTVAV